MKPGYQVVARPRQRVRERYSAIEFGVRKVYVGESMDLLRVNRVVQVYYKAARMKNVNFKLLTFTKFRISADQFIIWRRRPCTCMAA